MVEQIQKQVSPALLTKFIQTFLLETNNTNVRWQAHSLILAIYKYDNNINVLFLIKNNDSSNSIRDHFYELTLFSGIVVQLIKNVY